MASNSGVAFSLLFSICNKVADETCVDAQVDLRLCCYKSPMTFFLSRSTIAICHFTMNA